MILNIRSSKGLRIYVAMIKICEKKTEIKFVLLPEYYEYSEDNDEYSKLQFFHHLQLLQQSLQHLPGHLHRIPRVH